MTALTLSVLDSFHATAIKRQVAVVSVTMKGDNAFQAMTHDPCDPFNPLFADPRDQFCGMSISLLLNNGKTALSPIFSKDVLRTLSVLASTQEVFSMAPASSSLRWLSTGVARTLDGKRRDLGRVSSAVQ